MLRAHLTDYLRTVVEKLEPFSLRIDLFVAALRQSGGSRIVDLCSGSGGPWPHLRPALEASVGGPVQVTLCDQFPPPLPERQALGKAGLMFWPEPVDIRALPGGLQGVRTIFDALHHFTPAEARAILQDAVVQGQPIMVFELLNRSFIDLIFMSLSPVLILLLTPFIRPFRWSRLVFTYLLPISLLAIVYDTLISTLRCYSPRELLALTEELTGEKYLWQAGRYRVKGAPVTYLAGWPAGKE